MGELTQRGSVRVEKGQRHAEVSFPRAYSERPHLTVTAKLAAVSRNIEPQVFTRRRFKVRVNAIPLVEQSYDLVWEAHGEVEPFAFVLFRWAAGFGAVLALYATMLELGWIGEIAEYLQSAKGVKP